MEGKIKAMFTFEIMGKPPEHIVKTLEDIVEQLGKQKGIEIINKVIHDAKPLERDGEKTDMFTSFIEVELEAENINLILGIVLHMLPAHVEIIEPMEYRFKNFELSSLLSELTVKIHKYDEIAKAIMIERDGLLKRLKEAEERCRELDKEIKGKKDEEVEGNGGGCDGEEGGGKKNEGAVEMGEREENQKE